MKIDQNALKWAVIVTAAFALVCVAVASVASAMNPPANSAALTQIKAFEVDNVEISDIYHESSKVFTKNAHWNSLQYNLDFTNQAELDRQAEENRLAISRAAAASAAAAQAALERGAPGGAPTSPAPEAPGNGYSPGTCTWYAFNRRAQLGRPIPNRLGNGGSWHFNAPGAGLGVDHTPEVGAILEMSGHVAIVEALGENNTVFISEMNWGGLYRYNTRWISNADSYWFIH